MRIALPLILTLSVAATGCVNLGPRALEAGRADYNQVLRDTADQQLLANLVRLRYRDRPYYLEVSAVTTQFSFSPSVGVTGALGSPELEQDLLIGGNAAYQEQPTVSYAPLQGDEFARRLLTPVTLDALVLLSHSGWSIERLLRICVQRVNGIPNAVTASGPTPDEAPAYENFLEVARALRRLQVRDQMAIGYLQEGRAAEADEADADGTAIMFTESALESEEYRLLVDRLGLAPGRRQYRLAAALRGGGGEVIGIQTRSLNGMLYYLAHAVRVPPGHLDRGLVNVTRHADGRTFDWGRMTGGLMEVRASGDVPADAAVRVRYRDRWYYIADADLDSKSTFSLLAQLFALQAGGGDGLRPVLTLPVGG